MDYNDGLRIAASGMSAQRLRLNLLASNLANANTTVSETGGPYQRRDAVFRASKLEGSFDNAMASAEDEYARGVTVERVSTSDKFRQVYDPKHPDANAQGYVSMPDINVVQEMVDLLQATRTYEANVQSVKALKTMATQALQIGG
jgi:flagellar basal-body rod protein FlgC